MSQLDIKIRKLQDNGSTFRANIETLYLGGVRSAKVDELRFELPEEWKNCTVTLHVQRLSGTKPDPQILDENNSALVDRRWTLEKEGTWMLLAINASGYIAMTKPGKYTCYDTIDTDTTTENITPSIYEQFVAEVTKYAKQALESMNAAKTSETNAKTSETNAKASADKAKASADSMDASVATCTTKAGEASASAGEAATSRQAAEKAQKAAEDAAALAGTRAGTDKDLNTENAPADAAAVGKAFASIIKAYDIALAAASWKATSDTAAKNAGWAYQCDATISGCTAVLEPSATVSLESVVVAQKAGLGSICSTDAGFCRFYAEKVPTADISLRLLLTNKNPV